MRFEFPQNNFASVKQVVTCCGTGLALLIALVSLMTTATNVGAKPILQPSPLSPLSNQATLSSTNAISSVTAGAIEGDREGNAVRNGEAATENAQPESPLATEAVTQSAILSDATLSDVITDVMVDITGDITVTDTFPSAIIAPEIITSTTTAEESTLTESAPEESVLAEELPGEGVVEELPLAVFEPTSFTAMVATGQVSLVLVGALFIGLLTTVGLVLTRR